MDFGKWFKGLLCVFAVIGAIWGAFTIIATKDFVVEAMEPVKQQVQQVSSDFIYWRTEARIKELESRLTEYEYEYANREMPEVVKKEYESRQAERDRLLEKMHKLEEKTDETTE